MPYSSEIFLKTRSEIPALSLSPVHAPYFNNMVQIIVNNLSGKSICYDVLPHSTVSQLQDLVQAKEGIPACHQGFVFAGRQLQEEAGLSDYGVSTGSTVHLVLRLRGGKGGFGALLRGQGRDGKVTSNFDAMRDLQGRRIRHSKCEEQLEEWRGGAHDRDLEKIALKHIKDLAKEQRRTEKYEVDEAEIAAEQGKAIRKVQDAVQDALASASATAASAKRKAAEKEQGAAVRPAAKKSKMMSCLEEIEDSDED